MGKTDRKKEKSERKIRIPVYGWLIPVALALVVNAGVLFNGFAWDDNFIAAAVSDGTPKIDNPGGASNSYYRPLIEWSYHLDRWVWGPGPFGFHFSVYLAHAITTLLIYLTAYLLAGFYQKGGTIAVVTASMFAVHPIHAEAVAWIAGRSDVFMALFIMLAFYADLLYRRGTSTRIALPLFVLGCVLGLLSKETAIPFLLFFPALNFLLPHSEIIRPRGMKNPMVRTCMLILAGFIIYRVSRVALPSLSHNGESPMTALTLPWLALGYYLKLLLIPYPLNLYPSTLTAGNAQGVLYLMIGIFGTVGLLWVIVFRHRTLGALGAVWFVSGLMAPLMVPWVDVSVTPVAERYAYLASGGFLLMAGAGATEGWNRLRERSSGKPDLGWAMAVWVSIIGLFSLLTLDRNAAWKNEATLWEDTIQKSPRAAIPHNNLGTVYTIRKRLDDAEREFKTAIRLKPDYLKAYHNLGAAYEQHHRWEDAVRTFQEALALQPEFVQARLNLGNDLAALGRFQAAIQEYQTFLAHNPDHTMAHMNLGNVYVSLRRFDQAVQEYQVALRLQPNFAQAYYNLGNAYYEQGRLDDAVQAYSAALKAQPAFFEAYYSLGNVYADQKRPGDATAAYLAALKLKPDDAEVRNRLGIVYLNQSRYEEASEQFKATLKLRPDHVGAHNNLGVVHARNGRYDDAVLEFETALKLDPANAEVLTGLGLALLRQGKASEARKTFEKALQIQPGFLPARQALNSLHH